MPNVVEGVKIKFSEFFSFNELTDSSEHKELVAKNREEALDFILAGKRLSYLLERIRALLGGKSIVVSSGFRGKELNIAVGSTAKNSTHQRFEAADIQFSHIPYEEAFRKLKESRKDFPELRKVILEKLRGKIWLHIEVKMDSKEPQSFFRTEKPGVYIKE